jgi:hypothetical protein
MRPILALASLLVCLAASPARAQDAEAQPVQSSPAPAPAAPPTPPPPPALSGGQQPAPPPPAPPRPAAPAEAPPDRGVVLEAATRGFASGDLQGGLLLGVHFSDGSVVGLRVDYRYQSRDVGSQSNSRSDLGVGLAGRIAVAGSRAGLDLALALDAAYLATQISGADQDGPLVDASGFSFGVGPQFRYWITRNLAVGYLVQAYFSRVASVPVARPPVDFGAPTTQQIKQSDSGVNGAFTLTASF